MRGVVFVLAAVLILSIASLVHAQSYMSCEITSSCSYTEVLYLKNGTGGYRNAHAQLVTNGSYPYVICCNTTAGTLSNSSCADVTVLKLSSTTNAHVQVGNYTGWVSTFDRCTNISISNAGSSTLTNFPAYINLTYDSDMQPNFKDIRFYSDNCGEGGQELDYEIENYTASDRADMWVRIPSLPSTGTNISIYYKNNTAVDSGENPTGVWDSNYVGVWHMTEENATDSTQYGNNGTEDGGVAFNASGRIDGANSFTSDGHDYINCSNDSSLNMGTGSFTLEGWVRITDPTSQYRSIIGKTESANTYTYKLFTMNTNGWAAVRIGNDTAFRNAYYELDLKDGQWHYVAGRVIRTEALVVFVDGDKGTDYGFVINGTIDTSNPLYIGKDPNWAAGGAMSNHTIDEIRISNIARSNDWINMTYLMVAKQSDYVEFGDEGSGSGSMYPEDVCLSETALEGSIQCIYTNSDCGASYECLASIASSNSSVNNLTNAHIGPCDEYLKNVCCRYYDSGIPTITIHSPQNTTYYTQPIDLNVSASETIDTWWYSLNGGTNTTFTPNTTITPVYGLNNMTVYANDSVGNIGSSTVWFTYSGMDMSITKIISPSLVVAGESETVNVNITVKVNQTKNQIPDINVSDEVPYDFPLPQQSSVRVWFVDYSPYQVIEITTNATVTIDILDQSGTLPTLVMVNITRIYLTDAPTNLTLNDALMITYRMTTDAMDDDEQKTMYTHAWINDNQSNVFDRIEPSYIYASEVVLRGYKTIWVPDLSNPQNLTGKIVITAIGGTVSELAATDYFPDGANIWDFNVTYYNYTSDTTTQLVNNSDYKIHGPYDDLLPDGTPVDVYIYNFTIYSFVNWEGKLYDNDTLTIMYNVSVLGGGQWILPVIIAGFDPQYQKHIKTEMYGSANVPSFDVSLKTLTAKVQPGEVVKGLLRMLNVGGPQAKVDVFVTYSAKTMEGGLIVERSETFAVVDEKEKELTLPLPESLKEGMYTFEAFVTYTGREAVSTDIFEVIGTGAAVGIWDANILYYILVAVMGIIIGVLVVIRRK